MFHHTETAPSTRSVQYGFPAGRLSAGPQLGRCRSRIRDLLQVLHRNVPAATHPHPVQTRATCRTDRIAVRSRTGVRQRTEHHVGNAAARRHTVRRCRAVQQSTVGRFLALHLHCGWRRVRMGLERRQLSAGRQRCTAGATGRVQYSASAALSGPTESGRACGALRPNAHADPDQ